MVPAPLRSCKDCWAMQTNFSTSLMTRGDTPGCHLPAHSHGAADALHVCAVEKVYESRAVRRGLALMNVTAWGAANTTEAVEEWLGSAWMRTYLADPSRRYDEDRYALQAVQSATVGSVQ